MTTVLSLQAKVLLPVLGILPQPMILVVLVLVQLLLLLMIRKLLSNH
jgi:hypothetical protein